MNRVVCQHVLIERHESYVWPGEDDELPTKSITGVTCPCSVSTHDAELCVRTEFVTRKGLLRIHLQQSILRQTLISLKNVVTASEDFGVLAPSEESVPIRWNHSDSNRCDRCINAWLQTHYLLRLIPNHDAWDPNLLCVICEFLF